MSFRFRNHLGTKPFLSIIDLALHIQSSCQRAEALLVLAPWAREDAALREICLKTAATIESDSDRERALRPFQLAFDSRADRNQ